MGKGWVYLVGAGPGDPELLTLKGLRLLREADVVVYDRLGAPALLAECPPGAELIYVGKGPGAHTLTQGEINELLVRRAREGKLAVRLKGGDPFVFGRGGEEAAALSRAGIPFEVVPGVTSAIAVPAYAGIPVTHRGLASSVGIVTGHEDPLKGYSAVDWRGIATAVDTLVILMGVGNLPRITVRLMEGGRSPATPAAVVSSGTRSGQRAVTGTLADIARLAREAMIRNPAVTIVGEVVGLRQRLEWYEGTRGARAPRSGITLSI